MWYSHNLFLKKRRRMAQVEACLARCKWWLTFEKVSAEVNVMKTRALIICEYHGQQAEKRPIKSEISVISCSKEINHHEINKRVLEY